MLELSTENRGNKAYKARGVVISWDPCLLLGSLCVVTGQDGDVANKQVNTIHPNPAFYEPIGHYKRAIGFILYDAI